MCWDDCLASPQNDTFSKLSAEPPKPVHGAAVSREMSIPIHFCFPDHKAMSCLPELCWSRGTCPSFPRVFSFLTAVLDLAKPSGFSCIVCPASLTLSWMQLCGRAGNHCQQMPDIEEEDSRDYTLQAA